MCGLCENDHFSNVQLETWQQPVKELSDEKHDVVCCLFGCKCEVIVSLSVTQCTLLFKAFSYICCCMFAAMLMPV